MRELVLELIAVVMFSYAGLMFLFFPQTVIKRKKEFLFGLSSSNPDSLVEQLTMRFLGVVSLGAALFFLSTIVFG